MPLKVEASTHHDPGASTVASRLERAKLAVGRLLRRGGAPARVTVPEHATRGGGSGSRLARLSATSAPEQAAAPSDKEGAGAAPAANAAVAFRGAAAAGATTPPAPSQPFDLGFPRDLTARYDLGDVLGSGGSGVVRVATDKRSGKRFACKTIPKIPRDATDAKRAAHPAALQREVDVLRRLRGGLNVASFEEAFEDDAAVHIVMELCTGGELWHAVGARHYSERTAASYMRAVLRTLAQCHAAGILHRDVKPGNFMLLSSDDRAPLKAVDFGLAAFFDPAHPVRDDLGLEGTPWYMAPEALASRVGPPADVWAAGVMAAQLLTGRFPFDDKRSPGAPSLSRVWRSILNDKLDTAGKGWDGISDDAKDFVAWLLNRDPAARPTAAEALAHPWLSGGVAERSTGRQLPLGVVARVQRYAAASAFKRTVLEHIAAELVAAARAAPPATSCALTARGAPVVTSPGDGALAWLFDELGFGDRDAISRDELLDGLDRLGYRLPPGEADRVLESLGDSARVTRAALAASQLDWGALQADAGAADWSALARAAFAKLDADGDGVLRRGDIVNCIASRLPAAEVDAAVRAALAEACKRDDSIRDGLSFPQFCAMLAADAGADAGALALYEDRLSSGRGRDCARVALERARSTARSAGLPVVAETA